MHNPAGKPDSRETGIVQRLRMSLRALPQSQPHVLIACSGGKDSVALTWLLADLRRLGLLELSLAHVHHGQHQEADRAADAVMRIGEGLSIPAHGRKLEQMDIDSHAGVGLEEAMRRERYRALAGIAEEVGADAIALGHHRIDQAETMLLHLMRGAGLGGLSGMQEIEYREIPWWTESNPASKTVLWRPLLNESAAEIAEIAERSALLVIEDPTNTDTRFRRNAIRHKVVPVLESIAPGSTQSIARSAEVIRRDANLLFELTERALEDAELAGGLDRTKLLAQPVALQLRMIRAWFLNQLPQIEFSEDRVRAVQIAVEKNRGGSVIEIGSGASVVLRDGLLVLES